LAAKFQGVIANDLEEIIARQIGIVDLI